jgi:hypothetical protein
MTSHGEGLGSARPRRVVVRPPNLAVIEIVQTLIGRIET